MTRFAPDSRLLFRLRPGFRAFPTFPAQDGSRVVAFEVNSLGFPGPELSADGRARVLVYGDSFVEGYSTPRPERFVTRLGSLLQRRWGRAVEAVDAGVGGYGPDQVSLRIDRDLATLRPDAVVIALFAGNDMGDLLRNKVYDVDTQGHPVTRRYRLDPEVDAALDPRGPQRFALWRAARLARRELASTLSRDLPARGSLSWALSECERDWLDYRSGSTLVTNPFVDHYDADVSLRPGSESVLGKRALMRGVLALLREQAAAAGVPPLAVVIPAPEDLRSGPFADELRADPGYRADALTSALEEEARAAGVVCVSLFPAFARRGGDALYYEQDLHWNAEAQDIAARLTAEALPSPGPRAE